ncbi:BTB/POZ domain-containing protein 2-like [Neocloeon triangulifer]|uniref:BTB/POZ domain-containing protein 2-like n=1 Tax=Neocloeon triangulifer TaxID=2078957 RepID=UPI00286F8756|nr:BTB/POZ domain-containing protein 2-like [Neocloeon triangulifer]
MGSTNSLSKATDWRDECHSLPEHLWYMYEKKIGTDLQVAVMSDHKQQVFECHRMIMRRLSFVFEPQTDGVMLMSLDVGDMDPEIFLTIIKFAYTDKIVFKSFNETIPIHKVASNYQMNQLRRECENFMKNNVDKHSVWSLLNYSNKGLDLTMSTDSFLIKQTSSCLQSPEFLSCSRATLELLLSQQKINATELQLIQAAIKWTRHKNGNKPFEPETAQQLLGPCFGLLRFLCLTPANFSMFVAQSGLMSKEDALLVLINLSVKGQAKLPSYVCKIDKPRKAPNKKNIQETDSKEEEEPRDKSLVPQNSYCNNDALNDGKNETIASEAESSPTVQQVECNSNQIPAVGAELAEAEQEAPSANKILASECEVFFVRQIELEFSHLAQIYESPTSVDVDLQVSKTATLVGFRLDTQVKRSDTIKTNTYEEAINISVHCSKKLICNQVYAGMANYGPNKYFEIRFKNKGTLEAGVWYLVKVRYSKAGFYRNNLRQNFVQQDDVKVRFSKDDYSERDAYPIVAAILSF